MSLAATQRSSGHLDGGHNGAWSVASSAVLAAASSPYSAHGCNGLPVPAILPGLGCGSPTLLQGGFRNPLDSGTASGAPPSHAASVSSSEPFLMTDVDSGARLNCGRSTDAARAAELTAPAPGAAEPAALSTAAPTAQTCNISSCSRCCTPGSSNGTSSTSIHNAISDARPAAAALPPAGPWPADGAASSGSDSSSGRGVQQQGCSSTTCATHTYSSASELSADSTTALRSCNAPVALNCVAGRPAPVTMPVPLAVPGWVASQPLAIAAAACGRGGLTAVDSPSYATTSEIQIQPLASGSSVEGAPAPELLRPRPHRTSTPSAAAAMPAFAATSPGAGEIAIAAATVAAATATGASSGASSAAVSTSGAAATSAAASSAAGHASLPPGFARRSSGSVGTGARGAGGMGAGGIYRNGVLRGGNGGNGVLAVAAAAAATAAAANLRHQSSGASLPSPGGAASPVLLSPAAEAPMRRSGPGGGGGGAQAGLGAGTARRAAAGVAKTSQITHQFSTAQRHKAAAVIQASWRGFRIRRLYLRLIVWRVQALQAAGSEGDPQTSGGVTGAVSSAAAAAGQKRGYVVFARRRFLAPVPPELPEVSSFTTCGRPARLIGLQRRVWFDMGEPPRAAAAAGAAAPAPPPTLRVRVPRRAEVDVMMSEVERILAGGFWRDGGCALSSAAASEAGSDQGLSMYMQARMRQEEREAEEALQMLSFEPAHDLMHKLGSLRERTLEKLGSLGRTLGGALASAAGSAGFGRGHGHGHEPGTGDAEAGVVEGGGRGGWGAGLARSLPRVLHAAAAAASLHTHLFGSLPRHAHHHAHMSLQQPAYLPLVPQPGLMQLHPSPLHQHLLTGYGPSTGAGIGVGVGISAGAGAGVGAAGSSVGSSVSSIGGGWLAGLGSIAAAAGGGSTGGGQLGELEAGWELRMPLLTVVDAQGNAHTEMQLSAVQVPLGINRQRYRDRCHVSRQTL